LELVLDARAIPSARFSVYSSAMRKERTSIDHQARGGTTISRHSVIGTFRHGAIAVATGDRRPAAIPSR
jgi:hypothetical protein